MKVREEILETLRGFRGEGAPRSVLIAGSRAETRFVDREIVALRKSGEITLFSGVYYLPNYAPKD